MWILRWDPVVVEQYGNCRTNTPHQLAVVTALRVNGNVGKEILDDLACDGLLIAAPDTPRPAVGGDEGLDGPIPIDPYTRT